MMDCIKNIRPGDIIVMAMTNHRFKTPNSVMTDQREYMVDSLSNIGYPVIISRFSEEKIVISSSIQKAILRIIKK